MRPRERASGTQAKGRGRALPLVGPAVLLYLVVDLVTTAERLDGTALVLLVLAALCLLPLRSRPEADERPGQGRVALLGFASGVLLVGLARPEVLSLPLELTRATTPAWIGALVVSLALDTPDVPKGLKGARWLGPAAWTAALVTSVLGAGVCLAPFEWGGDSIVLPHGLLWAPRLALILMVLVGAVVRLVRPRLGSTPEAIAASGSALFGSGLAVVILGAAFVLEWGGVARPGSIVCRALGAAALGALVVGHVAMRDAQRPVHAARTIRRVLAAGLALGAGGLLFGRVAPALPDDPVAVGVLGAALVIFTALLGRALGALADRTLPPDRGRLLRAVSEVEPRLRTARTEQEIGEAVLAPLGKLAPSGAGPLLWLLDPDREIRVDAAGMAHVESRALSPAIRARLAERPGELLLRAPIDALVVRRPELRPLATALEQHDALAVVALVVSEELEGALLVPRGARRGGVTLEEIAALERLAGRLGPLVAMLSSEARAQARAGEATLAVSRLEDRIEALEDELRALRDDARTLKAGKAFERLDQPLVAYGPAMRAMVRRAEELAPLEAPLLIRAERGTPLEPIARLVHDKSARSSGPLVVADCLSIRPGRAFASLFGEDEGGAPHPGWLRLAHGGSALLIDVPSLPLDAQRALADALATRTARAQGTAAAFTIDARILGTSRVDLATLVAAGAFDPELADRLGALTLVVPGLAERSEDLASLVLLSIDRACRALGRSTVGIEDAAMQALGGFTFGGGVRELDDIIERAVRRAESPRITVADLALDAPVEAASEEGWAGTWAELEVRMLEKALERAGGNKSEAARLLGLKRTTFLDKLRRAGLERPSIAPARGPEP